MYRWFALFLVLLLTACSGGNFLMPKKEYREQVKTLGVVPLLVDVESFNHPQSRDLAALLLQQNVGKEERLVELLRKRDRYFDVRPVAGDASSLYRQLVSGSSIQGSGSKLYRQYTYNPAGVARVAGDTVVDALLIVVLSGLERVESRRDRTLFNYLDATYRTVQARAAVVTRDGRVVWEYPGDGSQPFLNLQYPDFDEAFYNKTDEVRVKDITLPGLERTLREETSSLFSSGNYPKPYADLLDKLSSALEPVLGGLW
jgi:hypothetical protein